MINTRERRVDLFGSAGYPLGVAIDVSNVEVAATPADIVAEVVDWTGAVIAQWEPTPTENRLELRLTAVQTEAIGTVRARWSVSVAGRPWVGGHLDLSTLGVQPATSPWSPPIEWPMGDMTLTVSPLVVLDLGDPPTITTAAIGALIEDTPFEQTLTATSDSPVTWAVTAGGIAGLTLSSAGVLSGTPTTPGMWSMTVTATNDAGPTSHDYSGEVEAAPAVFDSFVLESTSGPLPWWESGVGEFIQEWTPPYANGFQFRAVAPVLVHGARFWRPGYNGAPPAGVAPELRLSLAGASQPVIMATPVEPAAPPAVSGWVTVMFAEAYEAAADAELYLWVASLVGDTTPLARQADYFPVPATSRLGLLESLDPTGRYATPFTLDQDQTPWGTVATVWYWLDPIVTAA